MAEGDWNAQRNVTTTANGNHSHTVTVENTGGEQAHNNQQPYISCYIWHRTA